MLLESTSRLYAKEGNTFVKNITLLGVPCYQRHVKVGATRRYWYEFVFEAYVNYGTEVIYLGGVAACPKASHTLR
ncbi:MAG: hypothetical protein ACRD3O_19550 [Terriglobia bacterium]